MRISNALSGVQLLCIETAPFIYFVERHPNYVDRMRAIFQPVQEGTINVITSAITITETLTKPLKVGDKALEKDYHELFENTQNISLFSVTASVAEHAAELRARYNLKTPDALQVATAIEAQCDAFLTNDLGIKRVKEVRILVLDELELDPP